MALSESVKEIVRAEGGLRRTRTLADEAAQTLRSMILLEKLPAGVALPERELSEALGISRTPLREAIRILAAEGLVRHTASRRPFVTDPLYAEICDGLRIQGALEALAGELACKHADNAELKRIARLNTHISDAADHEDKLAAFQADMEFHTAIVAAAHNTQLAEVHSNFNARLWRGRFISSQRHEGRESTRSEHQQIVEALLARDGKGVASALRQHLKTAEVNIRRALAENGRNANEH